LHELGITQNILKLVLQEAEKNHAQRILKVRLKVGEFTLVEPECVRYYFSILSRDTIAEGAVMEAEKIPLKIRCKKCAEEEVLSDVEVPLFTCSRCQSGEVEIVSGKELFVENIEVE